jgi:ABC-type dipeptide/oligopeptide/nickel transport system permease subunit
VQLNPALEHPTSAAGRLWRRWPARISLLVVLAYLLVGLAGGLGLLPDPKLIIAGPHQPPSLGALPLWLGTDVLGRSVLWRILAGTTTALIVGFGTALIAVPLGTLLGLLAGWFGGWVDDLINWLYAVVTAVPGMLLVVAVAYAMGRGLTAICIALAVSEWVSVMRLVRGEVLKHRGMDYVLAARLGGASPWQQLFGEVAPNVWHVSIIWTSLVMLAAIKSEVILTYLGIGVQDGASWGLLIVGASQDLVNDIWWPLAGTVAAMSTLILALSRLTDDLRDVLDPRSSA